MSSTNKKRTMNPSVGLLAPENRIFTFLITVVIVLVVLGSVGVYRWLTVEDPVDVNAGRVDASGLDAEAGAKSTDAYKQAMAEKDKRQYEAAKQRENGAFMPFSFDEDPVEPSGYTGDSIGECQCQMSEERFKEMLRRVGGSVYGSERDAMQVSESDIYLTTKLQLVDSSSQPLLFRSRPLHMDKSGALLDENGVGLVSVNNEALYLSKSGQVLDSNARQLRLRGELVDVSGKVILGSGEFATRPGNMKRAGLSDIYVTRDGQLVTLDGRGIRHSGEFVFRNDEKQLLNMNGAEAAWNKQAVYQNNDGQLVNIAGKRFETEGILFSYDGILINNDGRLTRPLVDIERIAKTDIFKNKKDILVDGNGVELLHYGSTVRIGQGNRLISSGGGTVKNRQGNEIYFSQNGRFSSDVGGGPVQTGFLKSVNKLAFNSEGHRIDKAGRILRRGDSDIFTAADGFLSDNQGHAIQFSSKDTFIDYDRELPNGAQGLITYDSTIVVNAAGDEVFISVNGNLINRDGETIQEVGVLVDSQGVLLNASGKKIASSGSLERVTTKDGKPVTLNGKEVYRGADGALYDADGNPLLSDSGAAIFMDENGRIVDEFGRVMDDVVLRAGDREVQNGELTTRKAVTTGTGETVFYDGKKVYTDSNGRLVDENGDVIRSVDGQELFLDRDGNIIDASGNRVDEDILKTSSGKAIKSGLVAGREQVVTKSGGIVTYDGKAVYKGENGALVDADGNAITDTDGNRLYIDADGNIVNSKGVKVDDTRLRVQGEQVVSASDIATRSVLTDKDGNLLTYNDEPVYRGKDGRLYDKNNNPIKTRDGRDVYVDEKGKLVDKSGRKVDEPLLKTVSRETLKPGVIKAREALLNKDGTAVTYNGKPVYIGEDGKIYDSSGNLIKDENGRALKVNEDGVVVDESGAIADVAGLSSTGVTQRAVNDGELKSAKELLDKSGKSMTYNGKNVFVDDQGRVVDEDGNLVTDSQGRQVYYDENTGKIVDERGVAIREDILKDSTGEYISDNIKAGKTQVISKDGGVLTVDGKEAFVSEDGHLIDKNGNAILSPTGEKLFVDKNGNIVNAKGRKVDVPSAKVTRKDGLLKSSDPVVREVRAGELKEAQKLLDKSGKALTFNGKDVFVDDQGRVIDSEGNVVTDSQGRTVYYDNETGELVDVSGRTIDEPLLLDSAGKLIKGGITAGKKQVISKNGGVLTVDGKEAFVSSDGYLVDENGKALLSSDGKNIFLDESGNLVDETGKAIVDHKAKIQSESGMLRQATTSDGGVIEYDGKTVFLDKNGFLVDENGALIRSENGERIKMENGSLVTESGKRVKDSRFKVARSKTVNSGITQGKDQLFTKTGEVVKYKGQSVFRNKDGSLVTEDGKPVLTSDGRKVFTREDGTLVDKYGNVIDESLLTAKSGAVKSGDLKTVPVTDMKRVGNSDIFVAKDGSLLDSKGRAMTFNGKRVRVNESGALIDKNGEIVRDKNGNPVFMNAQGELVDKAGRKIDDSVLSDGDGVLVNADGKSVLSSIKRVGSSDIYTTTDGRLVDKDGKAIKFNGQNVYRGEDGRLRYGNGQLVQDERGRSVYLNDSGSLVDKDGDQIQGNILTDSEGVLIDSKGEKLNGGGKLTRIEGTDYFRAENGQVVSADGKPAIVNGKEVYVDAQGRLVSPNGRPIRYKGKDLYLGDGNRLATADGKGIEEDGRQLFLGDEGLVDEDGMSVEKGRKSDEPKFKPSVTPKPKPDPVKVNPEPDEENSSNAKQSVGESHSDNVGEIENPKSDAVPLDGAAAERLKRRYALIKAAMRQELAEVDSAARAEFPKVDSVGYAVDTSTEANGMIGSGVNSKASEESPKGNTRVVARAGTALYAINALKLNSDYSNRVVLDIVGRDPKDPLYQAKAFGTFERKYKKLVLSINALGTKDYGLIKIDAIALDVATAEVGLASEVDTHFWYRYGGLFAATILAGVSEAAAESGTREEQVTSTGSRVTTTGLEGEALAARALGRTGETFTEVLAGNVNRPWTAMLDPGEETALILFDDVEIPLTK